MIPFLDNRRNVGIIIAVSGAVMIVTGFLNFSSLQINGLSTLLGVGEVIVGELLLLLGIGFIRGKPCLHLINLFDDCESRLGIACSISAAFGIGFLISGIVDYFSKDADMFINNLIEGAVLFFVPMFILKFKGMTYGRVAHVILSVVCTFSVISTVYGIISSAGGQEWVCLAEYIVDTVVIVIELVYVLDPEVKSAIWDTEPTDMSG